MKHYEKITQEADLFGRYRTLDSQWDVDLDFDVLDQYSIYFYKAGWIVKNLKYNYVVAETIDEQEAFEALRLHLNEKIRINERIRENENKLQEWMKKFNLNEVYKEKKVENKKKEKKITPYLQNLQNRAKEQFHEWKENKIVQNCNLGNQEYVEALLNH